MYDIEKFFRVFKFLQDNPDLVLTANLNEQSSYYDDNLKVFLNSIKVDSVKSLTFPKDYNIIQRCLQARKDVTAFVDKVIFPGSYAYVTQDMALFRKMLIDWCTTTKTSSDLMIRASNAFSLDDDDVDRAIRSFGIDFVNKKTLDIKVQRALFLLALCDLYKIKGSSESIRLALQFANCPNVVIREWWYEKNPNNINDARLRGVAVKRGQYFDIYNKKYVTYDENHIDDIFLTSQNFGQRLADIGEPHWWYTNEEILNIDNDPETLIKLPSITPYFGVEYNIDFQLFNVFISLVEKIISEQFNAVINGNIDLVPQEIGVDGFNQDLTQKNIYLQGYNKPLSLLETYLGFSYCQIRYDEYSQYSHFKNYLSSQRVNLSTETYHYPWAFQELIYWCYKNLDMLVDGVIPLINIIKLYKPVFTNYYCSTNELKIWWINRPKESPSELDHTENNVPSIFFEPPFSYFIKSQDTFFDRILYYNGSRNFDFKQGLLDYSEIVQDLKNLTTSETIRIPFDDQFKSYHSSNRFNEYQKILSEVQTEILNDNFNYISDPSIIYLDNIEHDGSNLTPLFSGKYPRSITWNWAVDDTFFYNCIEPSRWIRYPLEFDWEGGIKRPDEAPIDADIMENNLLLENGYVYKYISKNKWARHSVAEYWDICDGSLHDNGHFKETSNLAKKIVKAKITVQTAISYHDDIESLSSKKFSILIDPYFKKELKIFTLNNLKDYLETNQCTVDKTNGLIYPNFSYFYEDSYLYEKVYDTETKNNVWIRYAVSGEWDKSTNGLKIYLGNYKSSILDLTNRYDAERILRGTYALDIEATKNIEGSIGDKILVCKGPNGYPQIFDYNSVIPYTDTNGDTKYEYIWTASSINDINNIDLGINNEFYDWINNYVSSEEDYLVVADKLLSALSIYVKSIFPDFGFDIASIYKNVKNGGVHRDLIEFFKPKRARLLYFAIVLNIDHKLNKIILGEELSKSKILQEIFDYVPRNDTIFIDKNDLINNCYHQNDFSRRLLIPERSYTDIPTKSEYYVLIAEPFSGIEKANGFYFSRPDLQISYPYTYNATRLDIPVTKYPYYLNDHNICLTKILNDELIDGYDREWVIAPRKENLHYCDAYFVCYDNDFTTGTWYDTRKLSEPHDGSQILPDCSSNYSGDVGQIKGNWAIDSWYLYRCIEENEWVRFPYEDEWDDAVTYTSKDGFISDLIFPSSERLYNHVSKNYVDQFQVGAYIYQYLNIDKYTRWIRYAAETQWCIFHIQDDFCFRYFSNPKTWVKYGIENSWTGEIGIDVPILPNSSRPVIDGESREEIYSHSFVYRYNSFTSKWIRYEVEIDWTSGPVLPFSPYNNDYECKSIFDPSTNYLYEYFEIDHRWTRIQVENLSTNSIPFDVYYDKVEHFLYINYLCDNNLITGKKAAEDNWNLSSNGSVIWKRYTWIDTKIYTTEYLENEYLLHPEETLNLLLPEHQQTDISLSEYTIGVENHWNIVHQRFEPTNFQITNNYWQTAFCKNILNFRKVFPTGILGYPENIKGSRVDEYDGDNRNSGRQEESHSFWSKYPYSDDQCLIRDSSLPILLRQPVLGEELNSDSDFNANDQIPIWWSQAGFDPLRYRSGPIHHRPVFIGIQQHINDCYPCRPKSGCCDYYDTGCDHDGPTNPHVEYFNGSVWGPGKYATYDLKDLSYDVYSKHHRKLDIYITDPSLQNYYNNESEHVITLDNPGDTYCTICDDPVFTPDLSFFTVSDKLKENGVYHNKLVAVGFEYDYDWINGTWRSFKNSGQEPIELESIGNLHDENGDILEYLYGYVNDDGSEIVHIFNRDNEYYYWEIRKKDGSNFETVLRSKLKKKIHTVEDLLDWKIEDIHVTPGKFLNGNDIDVAEDEWCTATPIEETTEENQVVVPGKLSSSTWIKFNTEDVSDFNSKPGKVGDVTYIGTYLYYCTESNPDNNLYTWKRIIAENNWTLASEPWIRPTSDNNHYGYMFMDYNFDYREISDYCYLYVYVDDDNYKGWVRHLVTSEFNSRTPAITNEFLMDGNTIHRFVFNPLKYNSDLELPEEKFIKYAENSLDYKFVCGVPIPYNETFQCIWSQIKPTNEEDICQCKIEEKIFSTGWCFEEDLDGSYIKIYVSNPSEYIQYEWKERTYFCDDENGYYSKLTTPPNFHVTDTTKYYFYWNSTQNQSSSSSSSEIELPRGTSRIGTSFYSKFLLSFELDNINTIEKLKDTTIIPSSSPDYDFIFDQRLSIDLNCFCNSRKYYINLYEISQNPESSTSSFDFDYDVDNKFYGEENKEDATNYCYFKITINETEYYTPIYQSKDVIESNTALSGTKMFTGNFISVGYACIMANGNLRFLPLYNLV